MDIKKYLLYKLSSAQAEVAQLQEAIASLGSDTAAEPANKSAAKVAAAKAAAKTKPVQAEVEEDEDVAGNLTLEVEEEPEALDPETEDVGGVSEQDVVKAVQNLAKKLGKPYVAVLLKRFKAKSIQDIKEKDYAQVISTIESTIKAAKK